MSSGVDSGQASGTHNSQLTSENFEYADKLAEIQAEIFTSNLTDFQKNTVSTVINTVSIHLTEKDYSGAQRDIDGNPVPNGKGGYFDHIHEMKDSYKALVRAKKKLESSLSNPNMGRDEKSILEKHLKTAQYHIDRIDNMFKKYGGIQNWK